MEITGTAGPWLALGVVLGLLVPALAALVAVALRRRPAPDPAPPPEPEVDDLPGFLESPPGSAPVADGPSPAWPALSAPPVTPLPEPAPVGDGGPRLALLATAVAALLLLGGAAGAAIATDDRPRAATSPEPTRTAAVGDVSAQLTFQGIVLERRAVGVTVAYPRVRVTVRDGRAAAELELPTFNCLRDSAPRDPAAAGCSRTVPEYAELTSPALELVPDGDGFRISGAFPTSVRPNGSAPVPTGRVYEVAVDVAPEDGRLDEGSEPATGRFELGGEQVGTSDEGPDEITSGG